MIFPIVLIGAGISAIGLLLDDSDKNNLTVEEKASKTDNSNVINAKGVPDNVFTEKSDSSDSLGNGPRSNPNQSTTETQHNLNSEIEE
tara:strand:- start:5137 stop:5400 length:264 start_codon:yes stop_codon:yes gene_type:complete